jgi:hypothetical protein
MKSEQLIPSLDPPSNSVNSAKLERHLNYSDGMVAVLTNREGGPSPHILYEITLAVRARKPVVVFAEDTLPSDVVPRRLLQQRFSHRSFLRQVREHRQALRILRSFLGEQAAPRYQPSTARRTCLVLGPSIASSGLQNLLEANLGYDAAIFPVGQAVSMIGQPWWNVISSIDVAIWIQSNEMSAAEAYFLGAVEGALRPLISVTSDPDYPYVRDIPLEYQARRADRLDLACLDPLLRAEFVLFEEDFLDLDDQDSVDRYSQQLIELDGHYGPHTRDRVTEVVVGDKYEVKGQVGAVGRHAEAHDMTFNQVWSESKGAVDLTELAKELEQLRREARTQATTVEDDESTAEIGRAQRAAEEGDGPRALSHLAKAGRWALGVAEKIGVGVATAAIKSAVGMP